MNATLVESFYFRFAIVETRRHFEIDGARISKRLVRAITGRAADMRGMVSVLSNLSYLSTLNAKVSAPLQIKALFARIRAAAAAMAQRLRISDSSHQCLLREALAPLRRVPQ